MKPSQTEQQTNGPDDRADRTSALADLPHSHADNWSIIAKFVYATCIQRYCSLRMEVIRPNFAKNV